MQTIIHSPDTVDVLSFYDATGEQIQCWNYHHNAGKGVSPQLLKLDTTLEDPDLRALEKAIEVLTRRHDSLRTCFRIKDGHVKQCVLPYSAELFSPSRYDVSDEKDREKIVERITVVIEANKGHFADLSVAPLWRSSLFKVSESTYYICLQIHHIISDVWSQSLIFSELTSFYEMFVAGQAPQAEPLTMQLKDYAAWQKKWRAENGGIASAYWRNKLSDAGLSVDGGPDTNKALLAYTLDNTRPAYYTYQISHAAYARLVDLSVRYRSGLLAVMIASLRLLFFRLKGKEKILISMPVASRFFPGMESIIGFLMGGVHLFQGIRRDMTIDEIIKESYLEFLESSRHVIFDHDELGLDKDLRLHCDVSVNFLSKEMVGNKKLHGTEGGEHRLLEGGSYYALSYHIAEYEDGLLCSWLYNPGVYPAAIVDHLMLTHERILNDMCNPLRLTAGELIS